MNKLQNLYNAILDVILPDQMDIYEMVGVTKKDSGVDYHLWISRKGGAKHGPRVKVSNIPGKFDDKDNFSLSVEHEPQIRSGKSKIPNQHLDHIKDWIRLNHEHLHKVWHDDTMDGREQLDGLKRI